jgi:hypothetical protein
MAKLRATLLAALAVLIGSAGGAGQAGGDGAAPKSIEGTYVLSRWGDPGATSINRMVIMAREGDGFSVRGSNDAWSGEGRVDGTGGYYNWVFSTGETGKTTFTINPDGTLKGDVRPLLSIFGDPAWGVEPYARLKGDVRVTIERWTYLARREKK